MPFWTNAASQATRQRAVRLGQATARMVARAWLPEAGQPGSPGVPALVPVAVPQPATRADQAVLASALADTEHRSTPSEHSVGQPERVKAGDPPVAALLASSAPSKARRASFTRQVFVHAGERYDFNLYVPAAADAIEALPLVVMLHGCQQDAGDFARGTAMNELATRRRCIVLYPEQQAKANQMRCWNWFDIAHQGRHAGEPAMLAALTQQVAQRYPVQPRRIYIAGLSAGGAMAAIVAAHHPELFAAVGVHSGLPPGAAHDVMSAFSAMRHGGRSRAAGDAAARQDALPTIVFHGNADRTVHPDNSDQIVHAAIDALAASGLTLARADMALELPNPSGELRQALRTVYRAGDGRSYVEYWSVQAGPHAWSGGNRAGSYTDPNGPSASEAMVEFFLQHQR